MRHEEFALYRPRIVVVGRFTQDTQITDFGPVIYDGCVFPQLLLAFLQYLAFVPKDLHSAVNVDDPSTHIARDSFP